MKEKNIGGVKQDANQPPQEHFLVLEDHLKSKTIWQICAGDKPVEYVTLAEQCKLDAKLIDPAANKLKKLMADIVTHVKEIK